MNYHRSDEYPMEYSTTSPYYCYVCGNIVGNRSDGENGGRGIFDISERAYHVVHYRCESYYFNGHTWRGWQTMEDIHLITRRYYIDHHIHWDWII